MWLPFLLLLPLVKFVPFGLELERLRQPRVVQLTPLLLVLLLPFVGLSPITGVSLFPAAAALAEPALLLLIKLGGLGGVAFRSTTRVPSPTHLAFAGPQPYPTLVERLVHVLPLLLIGPLLYAVVPTTRSTSVWERSGMLLRPRLPARFRVVVVHCWEVRPKQVSPKRPKAALRAPAMTVYTRSRRSHPDYYFDHARAPTLAKGSTLFCTALCRCTSWKLTPDTPTGTEEVALRPSKRSLTEAPATPPALVRVVFAAQPSLVAPGPAGQHYGGTGLVTPLTTGETAGLSSALQATPERRGMRTPLPCQPSQG